MLSCSLILSFEILISRLMLLRSFDASSEISVSEMITRLISFSSFVRGIIISKNSLNNIEKHEAKKICRYRPHKDAQYIAKILEYKDYLSFWVCVGTYNFIAPVYKQYNLPKNIINELEQPQFIEFLKTIFKKAYKIKYKK